MSDVTSSRDWIYGLAAFLILGLLLAVVESVRRHFRWSGEVTRKITHIGTGLLVFTAPLFLESKMPAVALGAFFTVFNFFAVRFHWLKGIHGTGRTTYGTAWYPLAFTILTFLSWENNKPALMTSMLVLALGDASAALIGTRFSNAHTYNLTGDPKSLEGSAGMFVVSFIVIIASFFFLDRWGFLDWSSRIIFLTAFAGSMMATAAEAVSAKGSDNLTIPVSVAFVVQVMTGSPDFFASQFVLASVLSAGVAVLSYYLRFLNPGGAVTAFLLGTLIFGL
jgi:dolichol kinase